MNPVPHLNNLELLLCPLIMSHNTRLKHLGFDIFDEFVLDVPVEADVTLLRVHTVQYSLQFLEVVVPADWSLQQHYIIVKGKKVRLLVLVFTNTLNAVQPSRQIVANDTIWASISSEKRGIVRERV